MKDRDLGPLLGPAPEQLLPPARHADLPGAEGHDARPRDILVEDDWDLDADIDRWVADIDAGRARIPEEWELTGPAVSISLGDASDVDPMLLAAMSGPDGLGGESLSAAFGQDKAADVLRPGPVLSALTEQAASDIPALSDDQLAGALSAARRLENRAAYLQALVIAEFARRREVEREKAKSRKVPLYCRPGQFPGEELAVELVSTARYADERIWEATDLATRLPCTLAGMGAGTIDATRAYIIWSYTWSLSPQDAARADEVLAAAAPGLRTDQLGRKAAALEMKLDPEAVKRRREHARQGRQRVEVKHERSGNAMIAGRELDPVTVLAAKANIDALAVKLRDAGREGSLQHLRAWIMTELLQGRNPLDQLSPARTTKPEAPASPVPVPVPPTAGERGADDPAAWQDDPGYRDEDEPPDRSDGSPAPLPALINILIPAGTLLGWSTTPSHVGNWGLLDADETRAFTRAASLSPRTRFCMTLIAPDGTALAHGCSRGQHPWTLAPQTPPQSTGTPVRKSPQARSPCSRGDPMPDLEQAQQLADLIRRLNITFRPIVQGKCDHGDTEDHYTPSRGLKHLIRARSATCTAPACNAQAIYCDLDHTIAYPDGPTCQCNLAPKCRRHHRCKQATGWRVESPEPGTLRWTVPSGRTYTATPTVYDL
ncbi:MAG: DUF222 domain-containing protein [Trebonia sp.]